MKVTPEERDELLRRLCKAISRLTEAHITRELFDRAGKLDQSAIVNADLDSATTLAAIDREEHEAGAVFWTLHKRGEEVGLLNYYIPATRAQMTKL